MMNDTTYRLIAWILDALLWGGELVGDEVLPEKGPAVFVANHSGALGPIAVVASLPIRVYPWVIGDMLDNDRAAAYLNRDFVEPRLYIDPPLSDRVAEWLSRITVRLLNSMGCIPVWQDERLLDTYRASVDLLVDGKFLLVFPEDPLQEVDPKYRMMPFKKGFTRLGEFYHERTGQSLGFYPLTVHPASYCVQLGKRIAYNSKNNPARERLRIKNLLENSIHEMYLAMAMNGYLGFPLHR